MMNTVMAARDLRKRFGTVESLCGVSLELHAGEVHCLLGDNGAGKSTLIKILSGYHQPSSGQILVNDQLVSFKSPRDALDLGIATVYQDLALVPLMPVHRNFFLGREPTRGRLLPRYDRDTAIRVTLEELGKMGIALRSVSQAVGTLSGGERQSVAIARATYFGARVLILDEPTSALGVKEVRIVLRSIMSARDRGLAIVFITHNVYHALAAGDRFTVLDKGRSLGTFLRNEIDKEQLEYLMAGGRELDHEMSALSSMRGSQAGSRQEVRVRAVSKM